MTAIDAKPAGSSAVPPLAPALFALTAFSSAALVFLVEPMIAKLILPLLGGSPAVWNTSLAFFQVALLLGYAYAHGLQRIGSTRVQTLIHGGVLIAGALVLPLSVSSWFGEPSPEHPVLWLLGVLGVSVGLPFAALSATAPLVQAWYANLTEGRGHDGAASPYVLYAASNLGSLLALLAYPTVVEPFIRLGQQTLFWSVGYGVFFIIVMSAGVLSWRGRGAVARLEAQSQAETPTKLALVARWWRRLLWVLLAAIPSSLMLGVTNYLATDVGSAPFLWVAPLALYLLTFIIAFQAKPVIPQSLALTLQGFAMVAAVATWGMPIKWFWLQGALQLAAFFLTALICHQSLAARRPAADRLTEFYLLMSLGGVIGGGFNAFLAPVMFSSVIEYPAVLLASCLVRPWGAGRLTRAQILLVVLGLGGVLAAVGANARLGPVLFMQLSFGLTMIAAFLLRDRALAFLGVCLALILGVQAVSPHQDILRTDRSFFGVIRISRSVVKTLGSAKLMAHGSTLHGAQFASPDLVCRPMVYYAPTTPIGQAFRTIENGHPGVRIGAIGMGAGTVAAYVRPTDSLRFFEIDPLVARLAADPANFSYIHGCAKGPVDWVLGDGRLTLAHEPAHEFDILLVDAFTSDNVPAHLLTVEAMRGYLQHIKPDGLVIIHLSNRHFELTSSVAAVAKATGAVALRQYYRPPAGTADFYDIGEDAMIVARDPRVLAPFETDPRWRLAQDHGVAPWTDDYTNLMGALIRGIGHNEAEARQFALDQTQPPMRAPAPTAASGVSQAGGADDQAGPD
jgi:hypothetical protein